MKKNALELTILSGIATGAFAEGVKNANALTLKQQSIVVIAAFTANGNLNKLYSAVEEGLEAGLTVNEIGEVMLQAYAYTGFPRSLNAQNILAKVLEDRKSRGIEDVYGTKPVAIPENGRYDLGREKVNLLVNGNATQARPVDTGFSATTDIFLKEHLFADIVSRNNMDFSNRELATVGFLSSLMTVNPQLAAHIGGALNVGNTEAQIEALIKVLEAKAGKKEAKNAKEVFNQVLAMRKKSVVPPASIKSASTESTSTISSESSEKKYPPEAKVSAFEVGVPNDGFAKYFTGDSYLDVLNTKGLFVANVTFEPSCRNDWHIHHASSGGGQLLIAVGGHGYYQIEGQEPVEMKEGDVVMIPANVKHWHGAAKDNWFSHLSIEVPGTDTSNEWLERVTDKEYIKLK